MSLINANLAAPVNAAVAANVLGRRRRGRQCRAGCRHRPIHGRPQPDREGRVRSAEPSARSLIHTRPEPGSGRVEPSNMPSVPGRWGTFDVALLLLPAWGGPCARPRLGGRSGFGACLRSSDASAESRGAGELEGRAGPGRASSGRCRPVGASDAVDAYGRRSAQPHPSDTVEGQPAGAGRASPEAPVVARAGRAADRADRRGPERRSARATVPARVGLEGEGRRSQEEGEAPREEAEADAQGQAPARLRRR